MNGGRLMSIKTDYATYLSIIKFISMLRPVSLSYTMASRCGRYLSPRSLERTVVYSYLRNCFNSEIAIKRSWESYLQNSGVNLLNANMYSRMNPQWIGKNISVNGHEHLQDAYKSGNGVLLLTGHQHHLILLCVIIGLLGYKIDGILLDPRQITPDFMKDFMDRLLVESRAHFHGGEYLLINLRGAYPRSVFRSLEAGHVVVSANDYPPSLVPGKTKRRTIIPFLGQEISCPIGSIEIARKTKSRIVAAFVQWLGGPNFELTISPLDASQNSAHIISQYGTCLEAAVRKDPGGWEGWKWPGLFQDQ